MVGAIVLITSLEKTTPLTLDPRRWRIEASGRGPMNRYSRPRRTADLSDSIHQQLNMYAVAAAAAGVGMLALSQPSEAKIVYTPANAQIKGRLNLDLNHDG